MRRLRLFTYIIIVLSCIVSKATKVHEWSTENIILPFLSDSTQYVADPDNYVSKEKKDSANFYLQRLRLECGVENVFIIIGHAKDGDAFRMAQDIGNKYGIGSKKTRRGLVIVIAVEDHRYFIAPGMGLEEKLTDVECDEIAQTVIVPSMMRNNPSDAVYLTSKYLYQKVRELNVGSQNIDRKKDANEDSTVLIILLTVLFFGYPIYLLIRHILQSFGIIKKTQSMKKNSRKRNKNDWFPPFFFGGGGSFRGFNDSSGGGFSGGTFGGGSFGGGGSGGSW